MIGQTKVLSTRSARYYWVVPHDSLNPKSPPTTKWETEPTLNPSTYISNALNWAKNVVTIDLCCRLSSEYERDVEKWYSVKRENDFHTVNDLEYNCNENNEHSTYESHSLCDHHSPCEHQSQCDQSTQCEQSTSYEPYEQQPLPYPPNPAHVAIVLTDGAVMIPCNPLSQLHFPLGILQHPPIYLIEPPSSSIIQDRHSDHSDRHSDHHYYSISPPKRMQLDLNFCPRNASFNLLYCPLLINCDLNVVVKYLYSNTTIGGYVFGCILNDDYIKVILQTSNPYLNWESKTHFISFDKQRKSFLLCDHTERIVVSSLISELQFVQTLKKYKFEIKFIQPFKDFYYIHHAAYSQQWKDLVGFKMDFKTD